MLFKTKKKNTEIEKPKKPKKVTARQASNDFVKAAKEFEESRVDELEKSKNLAWKVAFGACALAIVCAVALILLTPFKEVRPYVIRVDNNTGQTDIVTMLENAQSDYGEEVAKYFAAMYVNLYESYDSSKPPVRWLSICKHRGGLPTISKPPVRWLRS
ncbi:VirB8/TrbF family protein [Psychrobacter lutiphocae]|uniref:VirB8/TrbF family protein n=1 Tax=Psychrobacter lutiphocae TaxID=540500 RepID=UPI00039F9B1B